MANLYSKLADLIEKHPKRVILTWVVVLLLALPLGVMTMTQPGVLQYDMTAMVGDDSESVQGMYILADTNYFDSGSTGMDPIIVVEVPTNPVNDTTIKNGISNFVDELNNSLSDEYDKGFVSIMDAGFYSKNSSGSGIEMIALTFTADVNVNKQIPAIRELVDDAKDASGMDYTTYVTGSSAINFDTEDREGLYAALRDVLLFWIGHGVRIFRVDNPHTKAIGFWEWVIAEIHRVHPDVLFLAEAFTRPKRMGLLAKVGFTQSYSYFTWRNERGEIEDYARELFLSPLRNYLRPNFFANTPDILHAYLQKGGRAAFITRLLLAATLGSTYGIYSGFELCENTPVREGSEEYLDSEKYEIRKRDYEAAGNLNSLIARVNEIRHAHRALWRTDNLILLGSTNSNVIAFAKTPTRASEGCVVTVLNLDPHHAQESTIHLPESLYGGGDADYLVTDLLSNQTYRWHGPDNYVRLDPNGTFAHILLIQR